MAKCVQTPTGFSSTWIPFLFMPFLPLIPLLSLSQPLWQLCWSWIRHTPAPGLCPNPSLCLLSLSPQYWYDPLCHLLQIFPPMSFSQWGLPCPLNFKLHVTPNPSMLYFLYSTHCHLTYCIFYLFIYLFLQLSPSPPCKLHEYKDFQPSGSLLCSSNLDECLAHSKTS